MRIGYCRNHGFEVDEEYAQLKHCNCMPNTHRKCKYLKKYKEKEKFRYQPKILRRV